MTRQVDVKALISHIVKGDGADRCRICMGDTTEGQVYLEDTVMVDGEKPVTLAELLETITGVEMDQEVLCPGSACVTCANAAIAAQEFRYFVNRSRNMWSCAVDNLSTVLESPLSAVKSLCVIVKTENLSIQILRDIVGGDKNTLLNRLNNKYTKRKPLDTDKRPKHARSGPFCACPDCNKSFISPFYLNLHLKNSGQKEACPYCGKVAIRGQEMKEHLSSAHGETTFLCDECPVLLTNESDLENHKEKAHKPGTFTCGDCGRTFPRASSFEAHSQMHAVRTCRACGTQFSNRGCYREHRSHCEPDAKPDAQSLPRNRRSNIRDPATFICDYCGKIYHSRPQLKNHIIWIHMDIRPHQCQWCGKRFYTPARLAEHMIVHTRERNFECDICGAKLVSKMAAVYHRRRHTGEKPYKCEDCGERFISASRRSEHAKRRHGRGVRRQCMQCPANFVRLHELKKHIDKAHRTQTLFVKMKA